MKSPSKIIIIITMCLSVVSCDKSITLLVINRSDSGIDIRNHSKLVHCDPNQMVSVVPERRDHDVAIIVKNSVFFYDLTNTPISFLDTKRNKRLLLVFAKDGKLYLMKPSDNPPKGTVGSQPAGYPLLPKL